MKKLAIILLISIFFLVGCDWFQAPAADPVNEPDPTEEPTAVEEPAEVEEPVEAAADSEEKEIALAKCLTESGAKLYTASWCGHCKAQKEAFGDGLEYLDNTECAEGEGWAQACEDADITSVPTWVFADGTIKKGNTPLADLAELAGCEY